MVTALTLAGAPAPSIAQPRMIRLDDGVPLVNRFVSIADGSSYSLNSGDDSDDVSRLVWMHAVPTAASIQR